MIKRYLPLVLILVLSSATLFGQKAKLKKASDLYMDLAYEEAIVEYLEILDKRDNSEAKINLADCYRKTGNSVEAEYWYGQVVRLEESEPVHKLYYGMSLQQNGKCEQAKLWFAEFSKLVPSDNRGRLLNKSCGEIASLHADSALYKIEHLPINSEYDDFSSAPYKDGFVFASERNKGGALKREHTWTGAPFLDLFYTEVTEDETGETSGSYSEPQTLKSLLKTKYHDGPVIFNEDQSLIYFTRNNLIGGKTGKDADGTVKLKIFYADAEGTDKDDWKNLKGMPFNSDEYNVAHPAITKDGETMYFSSDMPGTYGGMDLWKTELEDGRWGPPTNLGPSINTEGHEVFPFVHTDGTLYFGSDGHIGLGGLDNFTTKSTNGVWSTVRNIGYPINSERDDFGFTLNENRTRGYFTSNREGGDGKDDIYSFVKQSVIVEGVVVDALTQKPIEGALVVSNCLNGETYTDKNGKFSLELPICQDCGFDASANTYLDKQMDVSTCNYKAGDKLFVKIPLGKEIEFNLVGTITNRVTGSSIPGVRIALENNCGQPVQEMMSDASGKYAFKLDPNCSYVVKTEDEDCYVASNAASTIGLTESTTLEANLELVCGKIGENPIAGQFFLLHIYYDFDKYYIRPDAEVELNKLYDLMVNNPQISVEIGSHTDARATDAYNNRLSTNRAKSVVKYLTKRGIKRNRLTYKGYGETMVLNGCTNDVRCTEEQHQRNRRSTFRIIKDGNITESEIPTNISIDPCTDCPF